MSHSSSLHAAIKEYQISKSTRQFTEQQEFPPFPQPRHQQARLMGVLQRGRRCVLLAEGRGQDSPRRPKASPARASSCQEGAAPRAPHLSKAPPLISRHHQQLDFGRTWSRRGPKCISAALGRKWGRMGRKVRLLLLPLALALGGRGLGKGVDVGKGGEKAGRRRRKSETRQGYCTAPRKAKEKLLTPPRPHTSTQENSRRMQTNVKMAVLRRLAIN